jgi:hypothetical protein
MQLTGIQALGLLTSLGVPAVALLLALLPVRRERLERFATTFGVTVTTTNGRELIRYLERTRRYRSLGGVLGWMLGLTVPVLGAFAAKEVWAIGGYLAGALLAELRTASAPPSGPRTASLVPRRVADYVSPTARFVLPVLSALALAVLAFRVRYPLGDAEALDARLIAVSVALLAAVVTLVRRHIVARPQRVALAELVAADDAVRASSMQTITGAGAALLCLAIVSALDGVDRAAVPDPFGWLLSGGMAVFPLLATVSWLGLRHWGRPVRHVTERVG